jgi:glutamine amidotransferase
MRTAVREWRPDVIVRQHAEFVSCERPGWLRVGWRWAMCRVLAYLGRPILIDDLLYGPDSSLVSQVYDAELYAYLNLGGFGLAAWGAGFADPDAPLHYRTPSLPTFDRNLRSLSRKLTASAVVAHIRGVPYDESQTLSVHNVHPFRFEGTSVVLAMNGTLSRFGEMRYDLLGNIRPDVARRIEGTTDSEWVYALLLSQLSDPVAPSTSEQLERATETALRILREIRGRHGVDTESDINLVVADGRTIIATRFAYDYGWYTEDETYYSKRRRYDFTSLWCTAGRDYVCRDGEWVMRDGERLESVIVASEPITKDSSTWVEVPEYAMMTASLSDGIVRITARELMV